jgi:TPR repeat protein
VPQDYEQAAILYAKSANQGLASAQYHLGLMYAEGLGIPQDYKQAFAWFTKAAEQGETKAQYSLGLMYSKGLGVPQNDKQAAIWYAKVANKGDVNTQFGLGLMYAGGNNNASIFRDQIALKLTPEAIADANLKIKVLMNQIEENKNK